MEKPVNVRQLIVWLVGMTVLLPLFSHGIEHHPGLQVEETTAQQPAAIHRVITGRVKRMAGEVKPESAEFLSGRKSTETFAIPAAFTTDALVQFYRKQFSAKGQILFECDGRDCGPSNYWSNQVFNRARLYGPLEYQHYMLAKVDGESADYVTLYFSQRGTGSRYLHVESISGVNQPFAADTRLISSMLRLQRRFVFDADHNTLAAIRDVINSHPEYALLIVAHSALPAAQTFDESVTASRKRASDLKARLTEMGADTRSLRTMGVGPAAPIERSGEDRFELVKLN